MNLGILRVSARGLRAGFVRVTFRCGCCAVFHPDDVERHGFWGHHWRHVCSSRHAAVIVRRRIAEVRTARVAA